MRVESSLALPTRLIRSVTRAVVLLVGLLLLPFHAMAATYAFQSTTYTWETATTNIVWDQTQTQYPRDDDKQVINIGFTFNFAGVNYAQVRVHANGALQFGADTQFHREFNNTDLPVTTVPPSCFLCAAGSAADRLMLVYWDDINPRLGGTVRYQTKGSAPNRRLVVSWENVPHFNLAGTYSFQVILYESGEFVYQYGTGNASGVSATIGVEVDDSDFTLYSFNSSYSYAGTAIRWFIPSGEPDRLAEYRFEEGALNGTVNEVIDWSGNGYNGQSIGAVSPEPSGYVCRGVAIPRNTDASISAINTNLDVDATIGNSGSITFWYRANNAWNVRDHQLLDATTQNNRWFFLVKRSSRALRFVMSDSAGTNAIAETPAQTVAANTWKHIAVTWRFAAGTNQTVLRIYIDGSLAIVTQTTTNGSLASSLGTLFVGDNRSGFSGQNGTLNSADGTFDSLRVYNYEISNADVVTDVQASHPCIAIDHIRIAHDGSGLTCNPETVTLQACADSLCSTLYTGAVTTTIRLAGQAVGTASFSNGSGSLLFNQRTAGIFQLDAVGTAPPAVNNSRCQLGASSTSCAISFADSGFLLDVPNMLAAKPTAASIRAVRKDDSSQACVPGFSSGTRSVQFSSAYMDPGSGTRPVVINGVDIGTAAVALDLNFDASASAALTVRYDDAGLMRLNASYSGSDDSNDDGLEMTGSSQFVSKPYGLCLTTSATCSVAGVNGNCPPFPGVRAGDSFPLSVRAVGWQVDGEASTAAALCAGNITTPNFRMNGIALSSALVAPTPGSAGTLSPITYDHPIGNQASVSTTISEVGVFRLTATPSSSYHGETVAGGSSDLVGRFIPAYLGASGSASLTPSCGSFSYQSQPMEFAAGREPLLTVSGYNRLGGVTQNYDRGAFWRLNPPAVGVYSSILGTALDARLQVLDSAAVSVEGADNGDGLRGYRYSGERLSYSPAASPEAADLPFMARISQRFSTASLTDADGACHGSGAACEEFGYDFTDEPGSEVRLGRLHIGNAHGPELQALNLPLRVESWQANAEGNAFMAEGLDNCSAALLGAPVMSGYTGNLAAGETTASLSGPLAGVGMLGLTAPGAGNDGSVRASFAAPTWLFYDWQGNGREMAQGMATFGIYQGAPPLIFRRELYGQ